MGKPVSTTTTTSVSVHDGRWSAGATVAVTCVTSQATAA
jgi:hypothetical protein